MIIVNKNGTLIHKKKLYKCALGKKGITKNKREGDQKPLQVHFLLEKSFIEKTEQKTSKQNSKNILLKNTCVGVMIPIANSIIS
jgi:L,D-peptidoglycan transpeptidase YkuD (ErfK/YbiS/YcfS/YnhG family)